MRRDNNGFAFIDALIIFLVATSIVLMVIATGYVGNNSDGNRIGTVSKFSYNGVIWSTWDGELIMGGVKSGGNGGSVANVWRFSVIDPAVVEKIKESMDTNITVKLHYKQVLIGKPWNGSTTYFVDSVKVLNK